MRTGTAGLSLFSSFFLSSSFFASSFFFSSAGFTSSLRAAKGEGRSARNTRAWGRVTLLTV